MKQSASCRNRLLGNCPKYVYFTAKKNHEYLKDHEYLKKKKVVVIVLLLLKKKNNARVAPKNAMLGAIALLKYATGASRVFAKKIFAKFLAIRLKCIIISSLKRIYKYRRCLRLLREYKPSSDFAAREKKCAELFVC